MDCPSEENLIKMKLSDINSIQKLDFDIANRMLTIYHHAAIDKISEALESLQLGAGLTSSETINHIDFIEEKNQKRLLWYVLIINVSFFFIEVFTGWISNSMALVADSLDMLADALVYGLSLLAVGGSIFLKKKVAKIAGYLQIILAVIGFIEVIRRFINPENLPDFKIMIIISFFALLANSLCLYLLQKSKSDEAHMQASMIFTSNDVIINVGVIIAGVLVRYLQNGLPDLIIGAIVFILVLQGAFRILKLAK